LTAASSKFQPVNTLADYTQRPMTLTGSLHDTSDKTFLGFTIPARSDGQADLKDALDFLCSNNLNTVARNVAPFIAKQLIQRLVSSNPDPAHVTRVVEVFRSTDGDLKEVIRAVLMDPIARDQLTDVTQAVRRSKLREPVLRLVQWARLAKLSSTNNQWDIGQLSASDALNQSPLRSPSVFNFFRPGYVPLNSGLSDDKFVAPEFQITDESSVIGYANFLQTKLQHGFNDVVPDYTGWQTIADEPQTLVDNLNLLLTGNTLVPNTVDIIVLAVESTPVGTGAQKNLNRVLVAFFLILTCPEYLVQR
jgi:uncharacterized protein (DUF1800 family)